MIRKIPLKIVEIKIQRRMYNAINREQSKVESEASTASIFFHPCKNVMFKLTVLLVFPFHIFLIE